MRAVGRKRKNLKYNIAIAQVYKFAIACAVLHVYVLLLYPHTSDLHITSAQGPCDGRNAAGQWKPPRVPAAHRKKLGALVLCLWMLRGRFAFARWGESPLLRKVKVHLPQITPG